MADRIRVATGDEIVNPRTGQRMVFRRTGADTEGQELVIECWSPPEQKGDPREPVHVHPKQEKTFRMIDGELTVSMNGTTRTLKGGEEIVVRSDAAHSFWNGSHQEAHCWQEFRPALRSAEFFSTWFSFARDGKVNARGMPGLLQMAATAQRFLDEIMVTTPPGWVQRVTFAVLAPIARFTGHEAERR